MSGIVADFLSMLQIMPPQISKVRVTMCLGVLVCYREMTLAYFELLGTLFCAKNLLHLILQSTVFCLTKREKIGTTCSVNRDFSRLVLGLGADVLRASAPFLRLRKLRARQHLIPRELTASVPFEQLPPISLRRRAGRVHKIPHFAIRRQFCWDSYPQISLPEPRHPAYRKFGLHNASFFSPPFSPRKRKIATLFCFFLPFSKISKHFENTPVFTFQPPQNPHKLNKKEACRVTDKPLFLPWSIAGSNR